MKTIIKSMLMLTCLVGLIGKSQAQNANNTSKLAMGKVEPYQMEVTYTKGRRVNGVGGSDLSVKLYISFSTISVAPPMARANKSVCSTIGKRICS